MFGCLVGWYQHKFVEKCKGSALILKKRIDHAKALKGEEKKRALALKKEQDSQAALQEVTSPPLLPVLPSWKESGLEED